MRRVLGLTAITLTLTACIGYERHMETTGFAPSAALVAAADRDGLTAELLLNELGGPNLKTLRQDGSELWFYHADTQSGHHARLLPVFSVRWSSQNRQVHIFEVRDDRVVRHWTEPQAL